MLADDLQARRNVPNFVQRTRLVIKPFKVQPAPPAGFEQKAHERLSSAVDTIQKKATMNFSREELYRLVESLCIHNKAQTVYARLRAQCEAHIESEIKGLTMLGASMGGKTEVGRAASMEEDEKFLGRVRGIWEDHCKQFAVIQSIFLYLDRTFILPHPRLTSLRSMGLTLLRNSLVTNPRVLEHIVRSTLKSIERDREGRNIANASLLRSVLEMLAHLEIYTTNFEGRFLEDTRRFFESEGTRLAGSMPVPQYLQHVSKRLNTEKRRVESYLVEGTRPHLARAVEQTLITPHVDKLVRTGVSILVQGNSKQDLALMYQLFSRVDALPKLKAAFLRHIKIAGTVIVTPPDLPRTDPKMVKMAEEKEKRVVGELLAYKQQLDQIVAHSFLGDGDFSYALKQGFESFIGSADHRVAELLARHLDNLLRTGTRDLTKKQADAKLDPLLAIFGFVQSKDVFQGYYQKDLANRLLGGRTSSRVVEQIMMQKLREACGTAFTKNMESMFRDISLSDAEFEEFRRAVQEQRARMPPVDLGIRVLSDGSWPKAEEPAALKLPPAVLTAQTRFKDFYVKRHKGRKLLWQPSRSSCVMQAEFPKAGKIDLQVTAFQATALLELSDREMTNRVSFAKLSASTGLDAKALEAALVPLLNAKLVVKNPPARVFRPDDMFAANALFNTKLKRIKVEEYKPRAKRRQERKEVQQQVIADRRAVIDVTIVRLMKMRNTMSHRELVAEVSKLLKFSCTGKDIADRIEHLIDKDYMDREEGQDVYTYKA